MADSFEQPPCKKQKISPIKSIRRGNNASTSQQQQQKRKNRKKKVQPQVVDEEEYFYNLHVNPDIILLSTDPSTPCNTNYDIEHDENIKPNLFIVQKAQKEYKASIWLKYHQTNQAQDIKRAHALLSNPKLSVLVITGAGMGCDSNLPDYRSPGGFWNDYSKKIDRGLSLYEMSKTDWFQSDPLSAWGFYAHRAKLYKDATPHSGFYALLRMLRQKENYFYMTSNIDGQAVKAGFDERKLYQTHGSLHHLQCLKNCARSSIVSFRSGYDDLKLKEGTLKIADLGKIPKCAACGGLNRPNVSFFSDTNLTFDDERIHKQKDKFLQWLQPFVDERAEKLLIVEIGCGKSVHSLRWEAQYLSESDNITLIRINPSENIDMKEEKLGKNVVLKLPAKMALDAVAKIIGSKN